MGRTCEYDGKMRGLQNFDKRSCLEWSVWKINEVGR
jgi:hypothetical protein